RTARFALSPVDCVSVPYFLSRREKVVYIVRILREEQLFGENLNARPARSWRSACYVSRLGAQKAELARESQRRLLGGWHQGRGYLGLRAARASKNCCVSLSIRTTVSSSRRISPAL